MRTATSKSFTGSTPGEIETSVYPEPIHFRQTGRWLTIDPSLQAPKDGKRKNEANRFGLELAEFADDSSLATVQIDSEHSIAFSFDNAAKVKGKADKDSVTYSGVMKNTDVRLTSKMTGVKEELILSSAAAPDRFLFPLILKGLTASIDANGDVIYKDLAGTERGRTPHGYMFDSNVDPRSGEPAMSTGVTYKLITEGKGTALEITLDRLWLDSPDRIWPITVDPDIYNGTWADDTYVMSPYVNNYSSQTELKVGTFNGGGNKARAFMHFDVGNLPGPVIGAQLQMRELHSYYCPYDPEPVHRVTQGWAGSTLTSYPGAPIDPWETAGTWAPGSGSCSGAGGNRLATWNVTGDVQGWQNGGITSGAFAATARSETDSYRWKKYRSYQAGDGPLLKITTNYAPATWNIIPAAGARPSTANVVLSGSYADGDGTPGYVGFGVYNTSGQLVFDAWSPLVNSYGVGSVTTSALPDGQYRVNAIASDGVLASPWTADQWFTVDTRPPGIPTELTPVTNSTVGSPFTASARYTEPTGRPGQILFIVYNEAQTELLTYLWSQTVNSGSVGSAQFNLAAANYKITAYGYDGAYSAAAVGPNAVTVAGVPSAPSGVTGTGMVEMAEVTWTPSTSNGGSSITGMRVTAKNQSGGPDKVIECGGSCLTANKATLESLVGGQTYKFIVEALNVMGGTASSPSSNVPISSSDILTPTNVQATPGDRQAIVTWAPPVLGGLLPTATGYTINTYRASDNSPSGVPTQVTGTNQATITNLVNGTPVYFKVISTTAFLVVSPQSAASNVVTPAGAPTPAGNVAATPGDREATVTWNLSDGNGSPITGYEITAKKESDNIGVQTQQAAASPTTFTGLQNGSAYYFEVIPSNGTGAGQASRSNTVSPLGRPFAPENLAATVLGGEQVRLAWEPPAVRGDGTPGNNGSAITGYTVVVTPACPNCTGRTTSGVVTNIEGLRPGTPYTFNVFSANALGNSDDSAFAQAETDKEPPLAPGNVRAVPDDAKVVLTWEPPSDLRGSTLTGYVIRSSPGCPGCTGLNVTNPGATSGEIDGLLNGAAYTFEVAATSDVGLGSFSLASNETIPHHYTYVALGDSYSSGQGAHQGPGQPNYDPASGSCLRSDKSYAPLFDLQSSHSPETLFLACADSETGNVRTDQLPQVPEYADLVTISIGGNDVDFSGVLRTCSVRAYENSCVPYFQTTEAEGGGGNKQDQIERLQPVLEGLYTDILEKAPNAQLVVFTYPQILTNTDRRNPPCYGDAGMQEAETEWIRARNAQLDKVIIDAATDATIASSGSPAIRVITLGGALISEGTSSSPAIVAPGSFDGHQVCNDSEWINGVTVDHSDEAIIDAIARFNIESLISDRTYHPNSTGYEQMLSKLLEIAG